MEELKSQMDTGGHRWRFSRMWTQRDNRRGCLDSLVPNQPIGNSGSESVSICVHLWFQFFLVCEICFAFACSLVCSHASEPGRPGVIRDIGYARTGELVLKLDLHLPVGKMRPPLVVW